MRTDKARVLHVLEATVAGTKRHLYDLVVGLRSEGWDVEVACPRVRHGAWGDTSLWMDLAAAGVPAHAVPMRRPALSPHNVRSIVRIAALMRRRRYAVVHAHSSIAGAVARAAAMLALPRPRVVYTPHAFAFLDGMALRRAVYLTAERVLGRVTDRLIAVSATEAAVARQSRVVPAARIVTILNGLDFNGSVAAPDDVRSREGWGEGPVVGTVGRLARQKDPLTWVEVAARVSAARPDVRFVWIGSGELEAAVRLAAERLGIGKRLELLSYRSDARQLMAAFDVFLLTSVFEGLPYVLIEALASAVPVVASGIVGVRDIVHDGVTGLLAPPGDVDTLAHHVIGLLGDRPRARGLAQAGQDDVRARFSVEGMVQTTARLYDSLLTGEQR